MKVAYLSVFRDATGYSNFAIDTALALDAAGVDVVCKNIKLATQVVEPPQRIQELMQKSDDGITHVIQHILPPYFSYRSGFKNIGFAHFETTHFKPSNWQYYCNLLDELWVSCPENERAARVSGVKVPIRIVPRGLSVSKYDRTLYSDLDFGIGNRYAFYHIGDYSSRKNTQNLIKCYLETFSKHDNVVLVLKVYVEGVVAQESIKIINQEIQDLKKSLRKYGLDMYPPIILISDYLDDRSMMALHAQSNCFISLERGAAYNLPAHDALAMGNYVIVNDSGGTNQFVDNEVNGLLIPSHKATVHGMIRCPYPNLYTCHEKWWEPDYEQFKLALREQYEKGTVPATTKQFLREYSYESVGNKIKEIL